MKAHREPLVVLLLCFSLMDCAALNRQQLVETTGARFAVTPDALPTVFFQGALAETHQITIAW